MARIKGNKMEIKRHFCEKITTIALILPLFMANFIGAHQSSFSLPFTTIDAVKMCKNEENTIFFLEDANKQKFVLKEQSSAEPAIHEKLGADIGANLININQVQLFCPNHPLMSSYTNKIATLHTFVPGTIAENIVDSLGNNTGGQNFCGGLSHQGQFIWLAHSESMCDIIALDLFINNGDRHQGNYSIELDAANYMRSHAFDMDWMYVTAYDIPNVDCALAARIHKDINYVTTDFTCCQLTYEFLDRLDKEREEQVWSEQEIKVLKRINETLAKLIAQYPSHVMYKKWMAIAQQVDYDYCYLKKRYIRILIEKNYKDLALLRNKIDTIVARQTDVILEQINNSNPSKMHYVSQKTKQLINHGKQEFTKQWHDTEINIEAMKIKMYSLYLSRVNPAACAVA